MSACRAAIVLATLVLTGAAASAAQAADKPKLDLTVRQDTQLQGGKAFKWDARRGRWGVTLDLEQTDVRPSTLNDVQAGAYYRITPSLRVGGAVALGDQRLAPAPKRPGAEEGQPRVRLETRLKF